MQEIRQPWLAKIRQGRKFFFLAFSTQVQFLARSASHGGPTGPPPIIGWKPMARPRVCRFSAVGGFFHLLADFCRQSWPKFFVKNLNFGFKNIAQKLRIRGRLNFYQPISRTQRSIWAIACVNRLFVIHKPTLCQSWAVGKKMNFFSQFFSVFCGFLQSGSCVWSKIFTIDSWGPRLSVWC